ncbi:unnamed protein product, partial [Schistosoma turkestanicum]
STPQSALNKCSQTKNTSHDLYVKKSKCRHSWYHKMCTSKKKRTTSTNRTSSSPLPNTGYLIENSLKNKEIQKTKTKAKNNNEKTKTKMKNKKNKQDSSLSTSSTSECHHSNVAAYKYCSQSKLFLFLH